MEKYIKSHWEAHRAPRVECLVYESGYCSEHYRVNLSVEGVELHANRVDAHGGIFGHKKKRESVDLIPWMDVLGASLVTEHDSSMPSDPVDFVINACVPKYRDKRSRRILHPSTSTEKASAKEFHDRVLVQWKFRSQGSDGEKLVPYLVSLIQFLADPRTLATHPATFPLPRRKYLVYINPVGGAGKAKQIYAADVAPLFQCSNIECEVVVTQHQAHATEHIGTVPLNTYDCVVAVGGDGLLSEIVQGIMKRDDWKRMIRQPLGIIPGGSGNALAASLLARSKEKTTALNAAYALSKGTAQDLDMATILNDHQEVMYSFLSLSWAFIADVDFGSERFRMFGGFRFTIAIVSKLLSSLRPLNGKIRYLCSENDSSPPTKYHERPHGYDGEVAPVFDCYAARPDQKEPHVQGEWKELNGPFHLFWGMNVTHGASDAEVAPSASMNDGYYHLVCIQSPFSRLDLLRVMLGLEDGSHVNHDEVHVIRTRAFTLHAEDSSDLIGVDGELFNGPHIQVEVHRALGRIVCLPS
ncbi:hypothetical protein Poli38472_013105 [Pythium oligandrum]|uniref:DAGKc domain-containing protein n=1 Tax=Pythium oligandrum TaxID=41045 RepID=A0A8K1FBV8_PYTOL|nr:hypothetical protein Poli38472_013105 [Pythium oligandrum]|eukprot:TMW55214.1 hypothetical protein Poli38472_013105 [Pythium oligandrum]